VRSQERSCARSSGLVYIEGIHGHNKSHALQLGLGIGAPCRKKDDVTDMLEEDSVNTLSLEGAEGAEIMSNVVGEEVRYLVINEGLPPWFRTDQQALSHPAGTQTTLSSR